MQLVRRESSPSKSRKGSFLFLQTDIALGFPHLFAGFPMVAGAGCCELHSRHPSHRILRILATVGVKLSGQLARDASDFGGDLNELLGDRISQDAEVCQRGRQWLPFMVQARLPVSSVIGTTAMKRRGSERKGSEQHPSIRGWLFASLSFHTLPGRMR